MIKMTTFDKCKAIRNSLLTRVGEALSYSWSSDFKIENLNDIHKSISYWEKERGSFKINPNDLTKEEAGELGFGIWSKESEIRLIPIWILPFLCDTFDSESISGEKHTSLKELDSDHRFGCLAYGIIPKK